MSLALLSVARNLSDRFQSFLHYLNTGIFGVGTFIFMAHPWILWSALLMTNVEGDMIGNYLRLTVLLTDAALIFVGGVWVQGRIKGEY
jgi:hypothetical protein